jgi:hypothetical protein
MQQTSRGKFDRLQRTTAGFTATRLDGYGLCCSSPTRPRVQASYPVLVYRRTLLLHASFRPRLATTPLRFANPSPPSGWIRDSHPQTVEHARHTMTPGRGQAWKSHARFPHPQPSYYCEFIFSCQVCWRTMRWHNGQTRRSENPYPEEVFQDCLTNGEKNAAHSILARSYSSNEGRIHLRRPTCHFHFSLATGRRTIHSGLPTNRELRAKPVTQD